MIALNLACNKNKLWNFRLLIQRYAESLETLCVIIVSCTCFRTNLHSVVAWMSKSSFSEIGAIFKLVWQNDWVFCYELSGCGFASCCGLGIVAPTYFVCGFLRKMFLMLYLINRSNSIAWLPLLLETLQLLVSQVMTS